MAQLISLILVTVQLFMVMTSSWAQVPKPTTFIPTLYVTSEVEAQKPNHAVTYQANICNTTIFKDMMMITRVNMPIGWDPNIGRTAKIQVCSNANCDKPLCTNFPGGTFSGQHNCTIPYNTTLKAVFVTVTAGNAPYISWTVAVEFIPKYQYVEKPNRDAFYYDLLRFPEPIAINKVADVKILQQIVPPGYKFSVQTSDRRDFRMAFCPDEGTTERYDVSLVVTALDSISAMSTYACLPPVDPTVGCTPDKAAQSDPRGIAINTLTISTGSGGIKDLYIAVVGYGDGEQTNHFLIGATVKKL
ncbi:uncharacterized protein LOC114524465 [Dendronephthya gigantea]|uniref:uncharacterized protein LOC114524465 n=1 Tax=Dendronephthya gigantea TaxID=151771 RepID=UPI00106C543A|nr:uncharacterized protein LOC114524465 [Dendronephthya gigantea]